ncbi:hypothetical protein GXP67_03985 [Rhodocytophaga rosea]|uniref:Tetratricopeptide repeat protein n=1 Tax=Rhodocytophaga rosea TaxID=2704465 RepID=A0A6C0GD41_9BACT|nr:hypothetical protein [Rhodocytophaga rosea]QHT65885.1 hypothetical protein GXP67_03985 [Rhodocytophaga rosea]
MAHRFFNQGLNLTYGFNHGEAERSYREAIRLDSTCAMCYWGAAYVLGTNYNAAMEEAKQAEAQRLTQKAVEYSHNATDWERALIQASVSRYSYEKTKDQSILDKAYAEAMSKVYEQFTSHDDIVSLYAESLMNLHPWDLYTRRGEPKPWTHEIVHTIESVLKRNPHHPGANHLYIHVVEASATPERGLASADRLYDLMPGAGHIVHMPSHIYIRTGDYHKGSMVNEKAAEVDSLYITNCNSQGAYPLVYFPHNIHFLAATAAFEGRGETSINAAFRVASHVDTTVMREAGMQTLQHYRMIPHYVLVKFMQWDHILTLPQPASDLVYPQSVWRYARGMAFAGKNKLPEAKQELKTLKTLMQDSTLKTITIWELNGADKLIEIASRVLQAEILRKEGNNNTAISLLQEATDIEDKLNYNEPPDWFFSVRHSLGAVLLENRQYKEAEKVFKDDLFFIPKNGWALNGLYQSLIGQKKLNEAREVKKQFGQAWQYADIELASSEVRPIAYRNINNEKFTGSYLAGLSTISVCSPGRK